MSPETEERLSRQLTTFEEFVKHLATKEELQKLRVEMILWIVGTNLAIGSGVVWWISKQFDQLYFFLKQYIEQHL